LLHGDQVELRSRVEPRRGVSMPWRSVCVRADGAIAAQARVELVLVDRSAGAQRRLRRRLPDDLAAAVAALERGPQ